MDVGQGTGVGGRGVTRVLLLAGTPEAVDLAGVLLASGYDVVSALVDGGDHPANADQVRSGRSDLAVYLRDEAIDVVVDATHPLAALMPGNAFAAAQEAGLPHCRLMRDEWRPQPGDQWIDVIDLEAAARTVATISRRVLLTIECDAFERGGLEPFAECIGPWFLVRAAGADATMLPNSLSVRDTPPFTFERERELLTSHGIDTIVAENSGGQAAIAKLEAARSLGLTVVMVRRPPPADGVTTVMSVSAAAEWVQALADVSGHHV